jgi:hypothetical protein
MENLRIAGGIGGIATVTALLFVAQLLSGSSTVLVL